MIYEIINEALNEEIGSAVGIHGGKEANEGVNEVNEGVNEVNEGVKERVRKEMVKVIEAIRKLRSLKTSALNRGDVQILLFHGKGTTIT